MQQSEILLYFISYWSLGKFNFKFMNLMGSPKVDQKFLN